MRRDSLLANSRQDGYDGIGVKLITLALAFSLVGFVEWDLTARIRGQLVASFDVARGHYEVLSAGLKAEWSPEYAHLLRERYGIRVRGVAGCIMSGPLSAYLGGYNSVSVGAANRKFGRDVFRECADDASRNWRPHPEDYQ